MLHLPAIGVMESPPESSGPSEHEGLIDPIRLEWKGPYSWRAENGTPLWTADAARDSGLYLWTVPTESGYLVHYVGQTERSFSTRHLQHLQAYLLGSYTINDPDEFRAGRRIPIYRGYGYRSGAWKEVFEFAARAGELMAEALRMLDAMALFVAPLTLSKRVQRRIEGSIISSLYDCRDDAVRSLQEEAMRYWRRRPDEIMLTLESRAPVLIRGLPEKFEA